MPWATAPIVVFSRSPVESSSGWGCWWLVTFLPPLQTRVPLGLGLDGPGWSAGGGRAGQGAGRVQVGALVDPDPQPLHQLPTSPGSRQRQQHREPPRVHRRLGCLSGTGSSSGRKAASNSAGGTEPMGSRRRRWLNQSTPSKVAYSTWSMPFQGPRRRISSVLYSPMIVSARALSKLSPREPTEATAPASASRSV